jgi:uncharacterized protein (TIGR03067 family)
MSKLLSRFVAAALVLGVATFAGAQGQPDKPKLEGMWIATAGEHNGQKLPENMVEGVTFRVNGDKIVAATKDTKEFINATFVLNAEKKPCEITMKLTGSNEGKSLEGLVERKGDEVKIIYALLGGEKPTEFKTKDKQVMYTLKLQKAVK